MKLILTLLALLTGFAGGDVVRVQTATPATLGAVMSLAEAAVQVKAAAVALRPFWGVAPLAQSTECPDIPALVTMAQSALPARGERTRE